MVAETSFRKGILPNKIIPRGFTLIELMVVIVILGILATFAIQNFSGRTDQARLVKAKQDIRTLESALQLYKLDFFTYPSTEDGLEVLINPEATTKGNVPEPYMNKLPKDPWDRDYQYIYPGNYNPRSFDIFSLGADGEPGGKDFNADIGKWDADQQGENAAN